jgi:hypothetical protein
MSEQKGKVGKFIKNEDELTDLLTKRMLESKNFSENENDLTRPQYKLWHY